jgi:Flp pilus assembly protein CpaB
MKRVNLILLTTVLVIVLLTVEIVIIRNASKYEPQVEVLFAATKIPEGTIIKSHMLKTKKINLSYAHKQSVRKAEEIEEKKAKTEIEEDEMILSSKLIKADEFEEVIIENNSNRLFSVEFKGDQANGWWLKIGQRVDIIFVPNDRVLRDTDNSHKYVERLRSVRIAAIIDEKGKLVKNNDRVSLPRYISFELSDNQCDFLAYAKGNGRIEISVIPE